jgi:hypothetical protein
VLGLAGGGCCPRLALSGWTARVSFSGRSGCWLALSGGSAWVSFPGRTGRGLTFAGTAARFFATIRRTAVAVRLQKRENISKQIIFIAECTLYRKSAYSNGRFHKFYSGFEPKAQYTLRYEMQNSAIFLSFWESNSKFHAVSAKLAVHPSNMGNLGLLFTVELLVRPSQISSGTFRKKWNR